MSIKKVGDLIIVGTQCDEYRYGCSCREKDVKKLKDRLERYEKALNQIAMLGCSEHAYSKEFTERVNGIARKALSEEK